jgi:hypothetical protein
MRKQKKEGIHLKSKSAVAFKPGDCLQIEEIDVDHERPSIPSLSIVILFIVTKTSVLINGL